MEEKRFLSIKQLAELLGVSTDTVRRATGAVSFLPHEKARRIVLTGRKSVRR